MKKRITVGDQVVDISQRPAGLYFEVDVRRGSGRKKVRFILPPHRIPEFLEAVETVHAGREAYLESRFGVQARVEE